LSHEHGSGAIIYTLDAHNLITCVSGQWEAFAEANSGSGLAPSAVEGHLLWEFVANPEVRYIWSEVLTHVRQRQRSVVVPLRCDSPGVRRELQAHLSPLPRGGVRCESTTCSEQPHQTPIRLLDINTERDPGACINMCSWCKAIASPRGWIELEEAVVQLNLLDGNPLPRISHVVCPHCFEEIMCTL